MVDHQALARIERIEKSLDSLVEQGGNMAQVLRPLIADARALRHDLTALLEIVREQIEALRPAIRKHVDETVAGEMKILGAIMEKMNEEAIAAMNKRFDTLTSIIDGRRDDGTTLEDTLQYMRKLRSFAGEPVTSAAEFLKAGDEVVVHGKTYVVGANTTSIGQLLYLNKEDGKIYPAPLEKES